MTMFDSISSYLRKNPLEFDFKDITYNSESFFKDSIKSEFAGWYNPKDIKPQIDFILNVCHPEINDPILDVACGHGRHSIELAQRGYRVKGIDISNTLIDFLNSSANHGAQFSNIRMNDIRESNLFGLIMVLGNSVELIPGEECIECLTHIYQAIKNDGNFFIQIDNKKSFIENEANKKNWDFHQGRWLNLSEHYFDASRNLEITRDIGFDLSSKSLSETILVKRLYELNEFISILNSTGFKEIEYWGDWSYSPYTEKSETILIKAKKE